MTNLPSLSASKLKTFMMCPRRYFYEYIEKEERPRHPRAILGSSVHKAIESTHRAWLGHMVAEEPVMAYAKEWNRLHEEEGLRPDGRMYTEGLKMVLAYDFSKYQPIEIEREFRLPFPSAENPICMIHGFIDQLFDWGFVDLKTSFKKPLLGVLNNDLQFILYDWAYTQITGSPPFRGVWHHLRTSEELDFTGFGNIKLAVDIITRLLTAKDYYQIVGDACGHCSYRLQCLGSEV